MCCSIRIFGKFFYSCPVLSIIRCLKFPLCWVDQIIETYYNLIHGIFFFCSKIDVNPWVFFCVITFDEITVPFCFGIRIIYIIFISSSRSRNFYFFTDCNILFNFLTIVYDNWIYILSDIVRCIFSGCNCQFMNWGFTFFSPFNANLWNWSHIFCIEFCNDIFQCSQFLLALWSCYIQIAFTDCTL